LANYRLVSVHIWNDPDFEQLTPSEKTIFLYLITNNATSDSGIYTVTPKKIANDTNVQLGTVNKLLGNCKNLSYDFDNKCIFIHNFLQYNGGGRPNLLEKALIRESNQFKTLLWNEFLEFYPQYLEVIEVQVGTVNKQFLSEDRRGEDKISIKSTYKESIKLTDEEHEKLKDKFGDSILEVMLEKLNNWKVSKGKTYKSDYHALVGWVAKDIVGDNPDGELPESTLKIIREVNEEKRKGNNDK